MKGHILLAGLLIVGVSEPAGAAPFEHVRVATEGARVGYHMSAQLRVRADEKPQGCDRFSGAGLAYAGELPPGIAFNAPDSDAGMYGYPFSGTPRQPGSWRGQLDAEFQCTTGPDQAVYRRQILVSFDVAP